jgi:hypothetical protein
MSKDSVTEVNVFVCQKVIYSEIKIKIKNRCNLDIVKLTENYRYQLTASAKFVSILFRFRFRFIDFTLSSQ